MGLKELSRFRLGSRRRQRQRISLPANPKRQRKSRPPGYDATERDRVDQSGGAGDPFSQALSLLVLIDPIDFHPPERELHYDFISLPPMIPHRLPRLEIAARVAELPPLVRMPFTQDSHDLVGLVEADQGHANGENDGGGKDEMHGAMFDVRRNNSD